MISGSRRQRPRDVGELEEVMTKCEITNKALLKSLKLLELAVREIAVASVDGKSLVPNGLDFLADASKCKAPVVRAVLAKLLVVAKVQDVETLTLNKKTKFTETNKAVFIRSVAARALDVAVVEASNSSGLLDEAAGAIFSAGYEKKTPVAKHLTDYLTKHKEWVFGDYESPLSKLQRRLLQRQFHRLLASLMDRPLTAKEIRSFVKRVRERDTWVTSSTAFAKLVEELILVAKVPIVAPSKKRQRIESEDEGVTSAGGESADSDSGASGWGTDRSDGAEPVRLAMSKTSEEVTIWIQERVPGFSKFANKWQLSQQDLADMSPDGIRRRVGQMLMGEALRTVVADEVMALAMARSPARRKSSALGAANEEEQEMPDLSGDWGSISAMKFGSDSQVSASQIAADPKKAASWRDSRIMWMHLGNERKGTVHEVCSSFTSGDDLRYCIFQVLSDSGEMVSLNLKKVATGLRDMRDLRQVIKNKEAETSSVHSAVAGRLGAKEAIADKSVTVLTVKKVLDEAYERMRTGDHFKGLGFGDEGFPDGESARLVWEELAAGGQHFKVLLAHKAFQRVTNRMFTLMEERKVILSAEQIVRSMLPTGGPSALKSLTHFNPSSRAGGVTKEQASKKKTLTPDAGGTATWVEVIEDNRSTSDAAFQASALGRCGQ